MNIKSAVVLLVTLAHSFGSLYGQENERGNDLTEDLIECSVLGVPISNSMAWSTGDVLIQVTDHFDNIGDKAAGAALIKTELYRFVFDFENHRFLQSSIADGQGVFLSATGKSDDLRNRAISAKLINGQDLVFSQMESNNRVRRTKFPKSGLENIGKVLRKARMCDLRGCWMDCHLGLYFSPQLFTEKRKAWDFHSEGRGRTRGMFDKLKNETSFEFATKAGNGEEYFTSIKVSEDHSMPTFYKKSVRPNGSKKTDLMGKADMKWQEINGVMVPELFSVVRAHSVTLDGEKVYGLLEQTVKFHWVSINDPVEEGLFKDSTINSKERILALMDPVLLGAEKISGLDQKVLESTKKQSENEPAVDGGASSNSRK